MENFNIVIGVNLSQSEAKIKNLIDEIGRDYPVKLKAVLDNESQFVTQIKRLSTNLKGLGVEIDTSKLSESAKEFEQDMSKAMKTVQGEADELGDELDESLNVLKKIVKEGKKAKTTSVVTGDKYNTTTTTYETDTNDVIETKVELNYEKQRLDIEKQQKQIEDTRIKLEEKSNDIARRGLAHKSSVRKLQRLLNDLTKEENKDLKKQLDIVEEINKQYRLVSKQEKDKKFVEQRRVKAEDLRRNVNANLDENVLGDDVVKIKAKIEEIFKTDTVLKMENAVRRVVNLYKELLDKQKDAITQQKQEAKDREKLQQGLLDLEEKQTRLSNEELDRQAKEWEDIRKLEKDMYSGREGVEKNKAREGMERATKEAKEYNAEQDRLYANQQRLNRQFEEFDHIIKGLRNQEFFDETDLEKTWELIDGLSNESKTLEKDLKAVYSQLDKVGKLSDERAKKQSKIDSLNSSNTNKADAMLSRGVVPENLINNFKQLSNSLDFESDAKEVNLVKEELDRLVELEKQLNQHSQDEVKYKKMILEAEQNLVKVTDKYLDKLDDIGHKARRQLSDSENLAEVEGKLGKLVQTVNKYKERGVYLTNEQQKELQGEVKEVSRLVQSHKDLEAQMEREEKQAQQLKERFESASYRASRGFDKNRTEAKEVRLMTESISNRIDNISLLKGNDFAKEYKHIQKLMNDLNVRSRELRDKIRDRNNSIFGKLGHAMKQVPIWISAMTIFYGTMNQVGQGFQSILDIDKALVNLTKVTNATNEELDRFKMTASEIGYELGVLTSDVIRATTEFQKLGYSLEEASLLGQNSILYSNVGDMGVKEATESIISAVKGFGIEVDKSGNNVRRIVDIFNEVGNNYAISSEGIGEALKRSSAILHQAGNSIEQSVALVTSANTTIQDPIKVGNAMKTVAMRLRGIDEEGDKVATLVPELEKTFNSFGSSIMKDAETFKSTFSIFEDLSKHWDDLTDVQRANLTELMGGKRQGAIISSMIENWTDATGSYETALNSAGSAQREFNVYMEGFEYKIGQLKVALEEFWLTLLKDEELKGMVDALTGMVHLMTGFVELIGSGQLVSNIAGLVAVFSSKSLKDTVFNPKAIEKLSDSIVDAGVNATGAIDKVKAKGSALGKMIAFWGKRLLFITATVTAITFIVQEVIDFITRESRLRKERIKALGDEIKAYETLKGKIESIDLNSYLKMSEKLGKVGLNTEEYQKYADIQKQIVDQMPELISHYDEHGNAVIRDSESIKQLLKDKQDLYQENRREKFTLGVEEADFDKLQEKIEETREAMNKAKWSSEQEQAMTFAKQFIESNMKGLDAGEEELKSQLLKMNERVSKFYSENNPSKKIDSDELSTMSWQLYMSDGNYDKVMNYLDMQISAFRNKTSDMNKQVDKSKKSISSHVAEFGSMLDEGFDIHLYEKGINVGSNEFVFMRQLREQLKEDIVELGDKDVKEQILDKIPNFIEESLEELENSKADITKIVSPEADVDEINKNYDKIIESIDMDSDFANVLVKALKNLKDEHVKTSKEMAKRPLNTFDYSKDIMPSMDKYIDGVKELDSAYKSLQDGNEFTISQTFDLIGKYPKLAKSMEIVNGKVKLSKEGIMELAEVKEKELKVDLTTKQQKMEKAKENAEVQVKAILQEALALEQLGEIKESTVNKAIGSMNTEIKVLEQQINTTKTGILAIDGLSQRVFTDKINRAKKEKKELEQQYALYTDMGDGIEKIQELLDFDFSKGLGGITSSGANETLQDAIYITDEYKEKIDSLNHRISMLQKTQDKYDSSSGTYKDALEEEIKLTKEKKKAIDEQIKSLESQIEKQKLQQTGLISLGKKENKTARARQAELQQEIDKAKDNLNSLKLEAEDVYSKIKELSYSLIQSNIELYNSQRDALSDDIAYTEYAMELYDKASDNYKEFAETKISYLKELQDYHEKELAYLEKEKETNNDLTEKQKENLNKLIRETREAVYEANKAVLDFEQSLAETNIENMLNRFADESNVYADKISAIRDKLKYDVREGDYAKQVDYLKNILALNKGQVNDAKDNVRELERLREKYEGNHEVVAKITDEISKWKDNLRSAQTEAKSMEQELREAYEGMADEFVDIYKKQLELMKQAEDERYQNIIDTEEKIHEKRMKNLDDEMAKLRDAYDEQMELIDRSESTRDYNNDLDRMRKEARELEEQISILSLDDSYEAKSKKSKLVKELAEKELQIAEFQHDRQVDLRKQDLEDDLEAQEEKIQSQKDKYQEDYDNFVENEEEKRKAREKYWQQMMNDERKFAQIREDVMDGNFNNLMSIVQNWSSNVTSEMGTLGDVIANNFTTRVEEAIEALKDLRKMDIGSLSQSINVSSNNQDSNTQTNNNRDTGSVGDLSGDSGSSSDGGTTGGSTDANTSGGTTSGGNTTSSGTGKKVMVTGDVWLHNAPNYDKSSRVRVLKTGEVYSLEGEASGMYDLGIGYASKKYFKFVNSSTTSNTASQNTAKITGDLYLRDGIGKDNEAIGVMKKGDEVKVLDQKFGWYKVDWNGKTGWAWDKYIQKFDTGGYTGTWGNDGKVGVLHQKELVLNQEQTTDILETARIVEKMKHLLPKLNILQSMPKVGEKETSSPSINNEYNVNVKVDSVRNESDAERVSDEIMNKLKRTKGGRF